MSRSPNDDRSDTMNPNNDAYAADHENRYGSADDGYDSDDSSPSASRASATKGVPQRHPLDELADPSLGPPERYRGLDFDALRWGFELALATPESEERDRKAAIAEALRMSEGILNVAAEAANRQGLMGHVLTGPGWCELVLGDGRSLRVDEVSEHGHLALVGKSTARFTFAGRAWREVKERWSGSYTEQTEYELDRSSREIILVSRIVEAVTSGAFHDGLANAREAVRYAKHEFENSCYDQPSLDPVRRAQERVDATKSKLPPGVVNDSWEDTWSPGENAGESGGSP